jgi:hypothetical protein
MASKKELSEQLAMARQRAELAEARALRLERLNVSERAVRKRAEADALALRRQRSKALDVLTAGSAPFEVAPLPPARIERREYGVALGRFYGPHPAAMTIHDATSAMDLAVAELHGKFGDRLTWVINPHLVIIRTFASYPDRIAPRIISWSGTAEVRE